ncbi:MAG: hypothetical protein EOO61_22960 [Hymenobacter sp.]|nr:MAG: hypothetical protein EOO61_22960 [Hymenobacter sp.]
MAENFDIYGFSNQMGPQLRELVEHQLLKDLLHYGIAREGLRFDWSSSCIEGHSANYLDGSLENFSNIALCNEQNAIVAEGWMEFILASEFFLVYWDNLNIWRNGEQIASKKHFGIPPHIWEKIPADIRVPHEKEKMQTLPFSF